MVKVIKKYENRKTTFIFIAIQNNIIYYLNFEPLGTLHILHFNLNGLLKNRLYAIIGGNSHTIEKLF